MPEMSAASVVYFVCSLHVRSISTTWRCMATKNTRGGTRLSLLRPREPLTPGLRLASWGHCRPWNKPFIILNIIRRSQLPHL